MGEKPCHFRKANSILFAKHAITADLNRGLKRDPRHVETKPYRVCWSWCWHQHIDTQLGAGPRDSVQTVAPASASSQYIFNSLLFLICGMVVMFMAAGFTMLEVGLVRSKNAATICVKNIALFSIASLMVWVTGYNIIYGVAPGGLMTPLADWFGNVDGRLFWAADDSDPIGTGYSAHSDWYFQMVFVATCASIVSGTLAERVKLWPFLIFVVFLTGFIYPIQASWEWGNGFLDSKFAFSDFAGSTLVHSTGGWAALAGALVLGPRLGKYAGNSITPMPGSSLPLATLGTFILWLGWFGFNGGSQLAAGLARGYPGDLPYIRQHQYCRCGWRDRRDGGQSDHVSKSGFDDGAKWRDWRAGFDHR